MPNRPNNKFPLGVPEQYQPLPPQQASTPVEPEPLPPEPNQAATPVEPEPLPPDPGMWTHDHSVG